MPIIINPGTEDRPDATEDNAVRIAVRIATDFKIRLERNPPEDDAGGFFGFLIHLNDGGSMELLLPGDDPDEFFLSRPFVSRRCYLDGNSWLWKYAASLIEDAIGVAT